MEDKQNKSEEPKREALAPKATPAPEQEKSLDLDALKALASTVRTALKNGHPDATKHLDALLDMLGS